MVTYSYTLFKPATHGPVKSPQASSGRGLKNSPQEQSENNNFDPLKYFNFPEFPKVETSDIYGGDHKK